MMNAVLARSVLAAVVGLFVASQAAAPVAVPATPAAIVTSIFEPATGTPARPSAAVAYIADGTDPAFAFFGTTTLPSATSPSSAPDEDSVYEIGSITKGLTGILLADMVMRGEVSIDDTLETLLPDGAAYPEAVRRITLAQLATHASGLPRLPGDIYFGANPSNPFAHYDAGRLLAFLRGYKTMVGAGPITPTYSNLGFGVLGYVLAQKASMPYEQLLKTRLLDPLGMKDTSITLSEAQRARLAPGHADGAAVSNWDLTGAMAGAGAVRSTAADMAKLLAALMHPPTTGLGKAIAMALEPRGDLGGVKIGFAWITTSPKDGVPFTWHDGGTGGYSSFIGFTHDKSAGIVALTNGADEPPGRLAVQTLQRIAQRTQPETPSSASRRIVLQLQWEPGAQFLGFYAAKDLGFFAEEGLDVEFQHGGPGIDPVAQVVNGAADIGLASGDQALMWAMQHQEPREAITVFGTVFARSLARFMSMEESAIRAPEDFRGKRVGVFPGQDTEHLLKILLERNAIPLDEVEIVPLPNLEQFERGELEAYPSYTINEPVLERLRGRQVYEFDPEDFGVRFYSDTMFARAEFYRGERDLFDRFMRAAAKGWALAESDTPAAIDAMSRQVGALIGSDEAWGHHVRGAYEIVKYLRNGDGDDGGRGELFAMDRTRWVEMASALTEIEPAATPADIDALCDFERVRTVSRLAPSYFP